MDYIELLETMRARSGSGAKYGLTRMRAILEALGHPERRFRSWLVAGTNGKGSTSAMLEAVARRAGLGRVGLNTSPHLNRLTERVRVDGEEVSPDDLLWAFAEVEAARARGGAEITFFETMTAMAFVLFAAREVELAVVEVGLGGRLDATNLLPCEVSAVVSIDLDHTRILGDTLDAIAREKAQVGRSGRPLVIGPLAPEALAAVQDEAAGIGARGVLVSEHLRWSDAADAPATLRHPRGEIALRPALSGAHQIENAAVAACVALEGGIDAAAVEAGLSQAQWRGRLEELRRDGRRYVVDSAHNHAGARALGQALAAELAAGYDLVIATSGSRDTGGFIRELAAQAGWPRAVRACKPRGHRLAEADEVAARLRPVLPPEVTLEVSASVEEALSAGQAPLCLVTGSLFLAGEALVWLGGEARDPFATGR